MKQYFKIVRTEDVDNYINASTIHNDVINGVYAYYDLIAHKW